MFQSLVRLQSPFSEKNLEDIRFRLLTDMKDKQFQYYLDILTSLKHRIHSTLESNSTADFLDDDFWVKPFQGSPSIFSASEPWWVKETPWLSQLRTGSATGTLTKNLFSKSVVDKLIGESSWFTPQQVVFFKTLITTYYDNPKLRPIALNIDMSYLKYSRGDETFGKLNVFKIKSNMMLLLKYALSGSGPFMLKILQQINNNAEGTLDDGTKISDLTASLFDAIPPLLPREFDLVLSCLNLPKVFLKNLNREPIGSASLAQAHHSCDQFGVKVILKLLRPIYIYYYLCECDFLLTTVWKTIVEFARRYKHRDRLIKQTRQLLLFLIKEFISEFDYEQEALYNVVGYKMYTKPSLGLHSAQIINFAVNPFPAMVQTVGKSITLKSLLEHMKTEKLSTIKTVIPMLYKTIIHLNNVWFSNVFWGQKSFFHADLHMGNIMVPTTKEILDMATTGETVVPIYLIDYGSSGILNYQTKCKLLDAILQSGKIVNLNYLIPSPGEKITAGAPPEAQNDNILSYFKNFDQLTSSQQEGLRLVVNTPKVKRIHATNIKEIKRFIRRIWSLCKVSDRSEGHADELYPQILNYSEQMTFGTLFLGIVKYGRGIGMCTSNSIIMFGRGIAYLSDSTLALMDLCHQVGEVCPAHSLDGVITSQMKFHPLQLGNFLMGRPICSGITRAGG